MIKNVITSVIDVMEQHHHELQKTVEHLRSAFPTVHIPNIRSYSFLLRGLFTELEYQEWYLKDSPTLAYQDALEASGKPLLKQAFLPFSEREPRKHAILTKFNREPHYTENEISKFLEYNKDKLNVDQDQQIVIFNPGSEYYPIRLDLKNLHTYTSVQVNLGCRCRSFASVRYYPKGPAQWLASHLSRTEFRAWAKQVFNNPDFRAFEYTYDFLEKHRKARNRWLSKHRRKHPISKKSDI